MEQAEGRYSLEKLWQDRGPAASVLPKSEIQFEGGYCRGIGLHGGDPSVEKKDRKFGFRLDSGQNVAPSENKGIPGGAERNLPAILRLVLELDVDRAATDAARFLLGQFEHLRSYPGQQISRE